ncbi:grasp-with-spasm system ATP-grasp peptide maturase [Aquimarina agarilytica]|uniref:grasp-with-spasm system ATP-grasp peptide maturase n=1 Tax=Aquimarina agarilytica TaxID=1087449 RepID=UPI0002889821|nr:grasp-with-spasm system ATP-grasp peptide maturase [Aquimarina agarilytica]
MILIISESDDGSTSDVIKWLKYYKIPFERINENQSIRLDSITISSNEIELILDLNNGRKIFLSKVTSLWYRRGQFTFIEDIALKKTKLPKDLLYTSKSELIKVKQFIHLYLKNKRTINNFDNNKINKLHILNTALKFDIAIPETLITSEKKKLMCFFLKHKNIITKPIYESPYIDKLPPFNIYTSEIKEKEIEQLPPSFFMSLFQKKIDKKYEVRIFYLDKAFYSMAIFSQGDRQTSIDFRRYKGNKPNRKTPYKLPKKIEKKLIKFMDSIDLNCGSIDMIVNKNGEHIFLEVNPVGQFNMVSYPCNYNLEKIIANFLTDEKEKTQKIITGKNY